MMHFKKHKWCRRQFKNKTLGNGMMPMAKKGWDGLFVSPGVILEFISYNLEKLISNEH